MGSDGKLSSEEGEIADTNSASGGTGTATATTTDARGGGGGGGGGGGYKWNMRDIYKYSYPRGGGYGAASGLYNLAWAQAVQNKPLNDVLVEFDNKNNSNNSNSCTNSNDDNNNNKSSDENGGNGEGNDGEKSDVAVAEAESDKEEGELEEGEIDFDSHGDGGGDNAIAGGKSGMGMGMGMGMGEMDDEELELQVSSVRKMLDNITAHEANKSFDIVCARLKSSLESLRQLVLHTWFPSKDALIQRSFASVQCVYNVFTSMTQQLRDQNKDKLSRLLSFVMSLGTSLFNPEQRKEVEAMINFVNPPPPPPVAPKPKPRDRQEELIVTEKPIPILTDSNTLAVNAGGSNSDYLKRNGLLDTSVHLSESGKTNAPLPDVLKPLQINVKGRGNFGPLLDLHKVHDEDSLPSPTSKTTPALPAFDASTAPRFPHGMTMTNSRVHPYETDAVKAVSSYQQKFGKSTFLTQDRLPSPTPSDDGNQGGVDDVNGEVSSFPPYNNIRDSTPSVLPSQPVVSSSPYTSTSTMQGLAGAVSSALLAAGTNPLSRPPAKSRDPRLRHTNPSLGSVDHSFCPSPVVSSPAPKLEPLREILNKKTKSPDGPALDGPALKRPRSGLEARDIPMSTSEAQTVPVSCVMEISGTILGPQSASRGLVGPATDPRKAGSGATSSVAMSTVGQSAQNVSSPASLQSLLKGIAGNPAAWMNVFKEQQKLNEPSQSMSLAAITNSTIGTVPLPNLSPPVTSGAGQTTAGLVQAPSQSIQDESTKLRMKPRDPRRVLHSNVVSKAGNLGSEQPKVNGLHDATALEVVNGTNTTPTSSQAPVLPDIAKQFTKNLKNIADLISGPTSVPAVLPISSPQSVQVNLDRVSVASGGPPKSTGEHPGSLTRPEEVVAGRPPLHNAWGDVEHLFEGFDDKQRAAIQQERARRMDEQKKMFADRKLCLVLDLDHTLLNSAKFSEVDAIHDEILRKKEEQDREKPRRHLFRFPHMAMWTKLRPGIWTFLEKASKLYELHLYTMGNKLYATEMAKVLDPKGTLFAGRVISRGDDGDLIDGDERVPKSKDLEGVLGMESAVVIIDDSVRVWPHNKLNLIVVERYTYFPCSRRQFGLPGPSLLEIDHDERPEEGTLASSLAVIEKIHQNFFTHTSLDDADVRNILASEQRKILAGCRIVFSRVFPVSEANPHLHPLWQTAEQFGAVCTSQIDEQVTHVVANTLGTDKANWAVSTGRYVVHPGWVEASALLYRRANEKDFAIKPSPV